jgi:chromosomal replication initiator protein
VKSPDLETRLTILRKRLHQDDIGAVEPAAIELIAERVHTNIRALEGAFVRVVAFASLTARPATAALASEVLDGLYPDLRPRTSTVQEIQEATSQAFGVTLEALLSPSRASALAWPRQVAMFLTRELTDHSLPAIGTAFGGRSHSTVLAACRRTAERIATDREAFDAVRRLTEELKA